ADEVIKGRFDVELGSSSDKVRSKKVAGEKESNGKSNDINMKELSPKKDFFWVKIEVIQLNNLVHMLQVLATSTQSMNVRLENSFSAFNDDEDNEWKDNTTWQHSQQVLDVLNESDSEVDEVITLDDRGGNLKTF
ncbi:hypothetical protein Tco_1323773, partial [Tanacetum coccineum]